MVRKQLIEKSRNDDCTLYIMLNCDEYGAGWYFGYQYPNCIDIAPFTEVNIKFTDIFKGVN